SNDPADMFVAVALIRSLISVPGHPLYASIMGYHAARRRFDGKGIGLAGGYLIAVVLHGTFDASLLCTALVVRDIGSAGYALLLVPLLGIAVSFAPVPGLARAALAADDADPRLIAAPAPA